MPDTRKKRRRGFAAMSPEKQRAIASKGGKSAHAAGLAHEWTSETAREAGVKGGEAAARSHRTQTPETADSVEAADGQGGSGQGGGSSGKGSSQEEEPR
jgi:uncharacterized protein